MVSDNNNSFKYWKPVANLRFSHIPQNQAIKLVVFHNIYPLPAVSMVVSWMHTTVNMCMLNNIAS